MEALLGLLVFGMLSFLMMRFGCGMQAGTEAVLEAQFEYRHHH